ncbi:hypothetical protein EJB05_54303, partial [Eragrostis curvula]
MLLLQLFHTKSKLEQVLGTGYNEGSSGVCTEVEIETGNFQMNLKSVMTHEEGRADAEASAQQFFADRDIPYHPDVSGHPLVNSAYLRMWRLVSLCVSIRSDLA